MNGRVVSVGAALELLVPPIEAGAGDWDEIIRRARLAADSGALALSGARRSRWTRRRVLTVALAVAVAATLVATPAFGIRGLIVDLFGRTNVPFQGATAPLLVKRDFFDLSLGLPRSIAPDAIASQTRRVASFTVGGRKSVLWVAPTRGGGYCYRFDPGFGGCLSKHDLAAPAHSSPGYVHPERLGVTFEEPSRHGVQYVWSVGGDLNAPSAYSLTVRYANGQQTRLRFFYVSKPINAGFFYAQIPAGHDTTSTRAVAVELRDKAGRLLARQPFAYQTAAQIAKHQARMKAMLKALQSQRQATTPIPAPPLPAPTPPLQRGQASGVTVVVGHNGVAVFDTSHATPTVRALITGRQVDYTCLTRVPYHNVPVDIGAYRTTVARVAIRVAGVGVRPPFLGCEIQGVYGHTWPDKLGSHSAIEIPFTASARRFFADRAAARDLALFVRSKKGHQLRRETGAELRHDLAPFASRVVPLPSPTATPRVGTIGFAITAGGVTFVEKSPTGKRFYIAISQHRIKSQNLKPWAFPF